MTVKRMRKKMPHSEYVFWSRYDARIAQQRELERAQLGG